MQCPSRIIERIPHWSTDATGGLTEGHTKRVVVTSDGINTFGILHGGGLMHMPVVPSGLHTEVGEGGREEVGKGGREEVG